MQECDSRSFFDSDATEEKMFERDWQRACAKEKFTGEGGQGREGGGERGHGIGK